MKRISVMTFVMRLVGIVLLCLAIVLAGYASITSSASWKEVSAKLAQAGVQTNIVDSVRFTTDYFNALSHAINDQTPGSAARAAGLRPYFEDYGTLYDRALALENAKRVEAVYNYYLNEFDFTAFLAKYDQREDNAEQLAIDKIHDYLDSLTAAPVVKGKVLPAANKAGQAEKFFPSYYETLATEHGEETVGTYYEFLLAIERMLNEYTASGNTVASAKSYMETEFNYDAYLVSRGQDGDKTAAEDNGFLAHFAQMSADFTGTGPNMETLTAFFEEEYEQVKKQVVGADYATFVTTAQSLIESGLAFDGSYKALNSAVMAATHTVEAESYTTFLQSFTKGLITEADKRAAIQWVAVVWKASALWLWLLGAGIMLMILASVLKKTIAAGIMRKQEIASRVDDPDVLLRVDHLKQYFKNGDYVNKAVDDVSFYIKKGEVFGLVGESGCGKTTTGRTIINLYDPTQGDVYFQGLRISSTMNGLPILKQQESKELKARLKAIAAKKKAEIQAAPQKKAEIKAKYATEAAQCRKDFAVLMETVQSRAYESAEEKRRSAQMYRDKCRRELTQAYEHDQQHVTGEALADLKRRYDTEMDMTAHDNIMSKMQMIFQDPIASINPRMTVREIIAEGLKIRGIKDQKYIDDKVYEMLDLVGLVPEHADRYPHEFSGGQRQRIGIARAIVLQPDLIIADEPISALDVSIQAQVINLLNELRNKMGLAILFIAHNLSVVKYFSDRIAVMYYGHIVEMADSDELFKNPLHPYTKSLLSAIPFPDPYYEKTRKRIEYNPTLAHDYTVDQPSMHEITPGHFIQCNQQELKRYREELSL